MVDSRNQAFKSKMEAVNRTILDTFRLQSLDTVTYKLLLPKFHINYLIF
jgi:hypothetical protein